MHSCLICDFTMNAPYSRFKLFNYPTFQALFNFKFLNSTWMNSFYLLPFPIKPASIFVRMPYSNLNIFTWSYYLPLILTTTWPFLEDFTLSGSCCFLHSCMTSQGLDSESNYLLHATSDSHDFIFINKKQNKETNKNQITPPKLLLWSTCHLAKTFWFPVPYCHPQTSGVILLFSWKLWLLVHTSFPLEIPPWSRVTSRPDRECIPHWPRAAMWLPLGLRPYQGKPYLWNN